MLKNCLRSNLATTRSLSFSPRICRFSSSSRIMATLQKFDLNTRYKMNSGYEIPVLGFGVYQTPADTAQSIVKHAIQTGYRHVDSAIIYLNEAPSATGMLANKSIPRSELFFTTKVPPGKVNYTEAKACIEESLQKTGLDYIDLFLLHAPYGGKEGRLGAWKALVEAVEAGKVRSIGVSNYGVHHLEELDAYISETDAREGKGKGGVLSVNQVELHPWLPRKDIIAWCAARGVLLEAYSPLVRARRMDEPSIVALGKKHGKTGAQILLRWSLQKGFVPLPKSEKEARIEENADLYDFELSEEDMQQLETDEYAPCSWDPTTDRS